MAGVAGALIAAPELPLYHSTADRPARCYPLAAGTAQSAPAAPQPAAASPVVAVPPLPVAATAAPSLPVEPSAAQVPKSASALDLTEGQQRRKGTATNSKWAQYESSGERQQRRLRQVHIGETLSAAVLSTSRLRLLLAALLALLLAARWDAAAVAQATPGGVTAQHWQWQPPVPPAATAAAVASPWASLKDRLQSTVQYARQAAAPLLRAAKGQQAAQPPAKPQSQLVASMLDRVHGQMGAAAASPLGQQANAALQSARRKLSVAAATPAGQQAVAVGLALQARLAAVRSIPAWQQIGAALGMVPRPSTLLQGLYTHLSDLVLRLYAQLAAAARSPLGGQALAVLDRLPPLGALLLLHLSLIGAAAMAMVAAPSLVHSTVSGAGRGLHAALLVHGVVPTGLLFVQHWAPVRQLCMTEEIWLPLTD